MSYSDAIFYLDHVNGSDAVRATLSGVVFSNPSGIIVRGAYTGHGQVTGAIVTVSGTTNWNGAWKITKVDDNNFDLDGAVWTTGADNTGDAVPFGGSSWADAWKTVTAGATAARIAAGDVVRIAKSADTVSLAQTAKWTNAPSIAGGLESAQNIQSSTDATPISLRRDGHNYSTGDVIEVTGHTINYNANGYWTITVTDANNITLDGSVGTGAGAGGASGTVRRRNNNAVVLTTALTQMIEACDGGWIAANSSTVAHATSASTKTGNYVKVVKSSGIANGTLYAYKTVPSVNLSAHQAITLWVLLGTAITADTQWKICLCSGTDGTGVQDEFLLPVMPANVWIPLTLAKNGGGNLYNGIQSIALYSGSAGANTAGITLDNINACPSPGFNLQSLISKNSLAVGGAEGFYALKAICGKVVVIEGRGYVGTSETVTTYYRETIKLPFATGETVNDGGTDGHKVQFLGGWNTATTTQDGETYLDLSNTYGTVFNFNGKTYVHMDRISPVRGSTTGILINHGTGECSIGDINDAIGNGVGINFSNGVLTAGTLRHVNANTGNGINLLPTVCTITEIGQCNGNGVVGLYFANNSPAITITTIGDASNNASYGLHFYAGYNLVALKISTITRASYNGTAGILFYVTRGCVIETVGAADYNGTNGINFGDRAVGIEINTVTQSNNNGGYAIAYNAASFDNVIGSLATSGNATGAIQSRARQNFIGKATLAETTKIDQSGDLEGFVGIGEYGGTEGRWYREYQWGVSSDQITGGQDAAWAYGGSGLCQYYSPKHAVYPFFEEFFIPCTKNTAFQVHFFVKKTSAAANPTMQVSISGCGVTAIRRADVTLTDSWAEYTSASLTPTTTGFVKVRFEFLDGATTGDIGVDDIHYA